MIKVERIYAMSQCGGIGYAPVLYRVGRVYYTVRGDTEAADIRLLSSLIPKSKKRRANGYSLWRKHRHDNILTAMQFLSKLRETTSKGNHENKNRQD